jgi:uncharacterized protein
MNLDHDGLVDAVKRHALSYGSPDHGFEHCVAVATTGLKLSVSTGADPEIVWAFGLLHDSMRLNEWSDPDHGKRAADLARLLHSELDLHLDDDQMLTLVYALVWHDRGMTTPDPTIGTCWDADRLQLPRVGIIVDPAYLSTDAGRARVTV